MNEAMEVVEGVKELGSTIMSLLGDRHIHHILGISHASSENRLTVHRSLTKQDWMIVMPMVTLAWNYVLK